MIDPWPAFFIAGTTARIPRKTPVRLMSRMRCHSDHLEVLDRADVEDARIVDQDVDAAELGNGRRHGRIPVFGPGDVEVDIARVLPEFLRHQLAVGVEDVAAHHLRAVGDHLAGMRGAHPPGSAADQRDLARQPSCHESSCCPCIFRSKSAESGRWVHFQ